MKFDVNVFRYIEKDAWRVLVSVEMGMKNHELVPVELINAISGLKHGGAYKFIRELLKHKLVHHDNSKYDAYRLTPLGYDYLAIKAFVNRGAIDGVGRRIGVGKESDVYEVVTEEGETLALKLHRLGRTSFRAVKSKRDYIKKTTTHTSWLYLSRLAALKEHAFMKALGDNGFPVPVAVDVNRHAVLMSIVDGSPLTQVGPSRLKDGVANVYRQCVDQLENMARHGLVHCDYNEFNIMVDTESTDITVIDFPQMVSTKHPNAEELFDRDLKCLHKFFLRRFDYRAAEDDDGRSRGERRDGERVALTSTASVVEWMVRSTDDMLDDLEAREPPGAVAAWALSKRAESVVGNPAVKKTVDVVGKVGVAAVRAAAPVVADGAGKVVKEGSKLAVKAAVSAATAKVGYDKREREKERSTPFGGLLGGNKKTPPLESEREKKKNPFAFPSLAKKPEPEPPRGLFGRKKDDKPKRGFFGGK